MTNTKPTSKTVLVTGSASGIGRATAIHFAKAGYRVALLDLQGSPLEETLKLLPKADAPHAIYFADVSSENELKSAFEKIALEFGSLSAAVNNAGIDGGTKKFLDYVDSDFDRVIAVNLKGTFLCLQHELRMMSKQGYGSIVNLSSILGLVGAPGSSIYSASKHGVMGLTKSLATEFARKGIRINAVCPGGVETAMIARARDGNAPLIDRVLMAHPMNRFANPEEIAKAIFWLCSDDASFVTGAGLAADGGYTAQ